MEGCTHTRLNANEFKEILLKPRRKAGVAIGDDILGHAVQALIMPGKKADKVIGFLTIDLKRNKVGHLYEGINHDPDRITTI